MGFGNVSGPVNRATNKASARGGAIVRTPAGSHGHQSELAKTDASRTSLAALNLIIDGLIKPKYQMPAHVSQHGYVLPGQRAKIGKDWQIGSICPYVYPGAQPGDFTSSLTSSGYGFKFHYNPQSLSVSAPSGFNYQPSELDTLMPLTDSQGTVSFTLLLNRSEDLYDKKVLPQPMLGYSNIASLGTQYDIEWFFRTINGVRKDQDPARSSADVGLLLATPQLLTFSSALKFPGYVQSVSIDHVKFTPSMIPIISIMNVTFGRFTNAQLPQTPADQAALQSSSVNAPTW
jgi:hypothetical protein